MARLSVHGFELRQYFAEGLAAVGGTTAFSNEQARTGSYSFKATSSGGSDSYFELSFFASTLGYVYTRGYFYLTAYPDAGTLTLIQQSIVGGRTEQLVIDSSGQVGITGTGAAWSDPTPLFGSPTISLELNRWYRLELAVFVDNTNDIIHRRTRVDGIPHVSLDVAESLAGVSVLTAFMGAIGKGDAAVGSNKTVYIDDVAVNDAAGSHQTSWPGEGSIVYLNPTGGPTSTGGWTNSAGNTVNMNAYIQPPPFSVGHIQHGTTGQNHYITNVPSWSSVGITSNSQLQVIALLTVFGKFGGPNDLRHLYVGWWNHASASEFAAVPPVVAFGGDYPANWTRLIPVLTNPALFTSSAININTNAQPYLRRGDGIGGLMVAPILGMYVEFKKPQDTAFDPIATGDLVLTSSAQRSAALATTGASVLTAVAQRQRTTAAALTGASQLDLSGHFTAGGAFGLSALADFDLTSYLTAAGHLGLSGASDFASVGQRERLDSAMLAAASDLSLAAQRTRSTAATFSAATNLLLASVTDILAALDFTALTTLTANGFLHRVGVAAWQGGAEFAMAPAIERTTSFPIIAASTLAATATRERETALHASATSEFTATATALYAIGFDLAATGMLFLSVEAGGLVLASLALDTNGSLSLSAARTLRGDLAVSSATDLTLPIPLRLRAMSASLAAASHLSLASVIEANAALSLASDADVGMVAARLRHIVASFDATSGVSLLGQRDRLATATYDATANLSLTVDLTVLAQLLLTAASDLGLAGDRERQMLLGLGAQGNLNAQVVRDLVSTFDLTAVGYLLITPHVVEYLPSIEYFFKRYGNVYYRDVPSQLLLIPIARLPFFRDQPSTLLRGRPREPFFIKLDADDREGG